MIHSQIERLSRTTIILIIAAGAALIPLLLAGAVSGIANPLFDLLAAAHYILQLTALFTTLILVNRLSAGSKALQFSVLGTLLVFLVSVAILGAVPITARDALIHHLAVPRWWIETGRIHQIRWHEWSYYPMLLELGFTGLMKYGEVWLTPYYHASFLVLLAGSVAILLERAGRSAAESCAGFCIMLTIPIAFRLATIPDVDLGLALYTSTAVIAIIIWGEKRANVFWATLAGISLGLAISTKYNGILASVVIIPLVLVYGQRVRVPILKNIGSIILISAVAVCTFLPWAYKDFLWTGNPVYPLFNNIFGVQQIASGPHGLSPLQQRVMLYGESWLDIWLTPLRMLVLGVDDNPKFFDGALTPILIFAAIPLFKKNRAPWVIFLSLLAVFYFLFAQVYAAPRVRYLAPIFGPLAALATCGVFQFASFFKKSHAVILVTLLLVHCACFGYYLSTLFISTGAIDYLRSNSTRDEYLARHLREYGMIQFVNHETPPHSRVYLLYTGNKFFLYDRAVLSSGHFSGTDLLEWIRSAKTPAALEKQFEKRGVTYFATNTQLLSQQFPAELSASQLQLWEDFVKQYVTAQFEDGPFGVFHIASHPDQTAS